MTDKLQQLRTMTTVVADTGDIEAIRRYKPEDATTNPSLLLKAAALPGYAGLLAKARAAGQNTPGESTAQHAAACDRFAVDVGCEILELIPGRVSTEVDARLSFDTEATLARARQIISLYEGAGVDRSRILIKIASTWEGVQAARALEREGIQCNLTLLFSFEQAQACADAGVFLISPFVGRILDWYRIREGLEVERADADPGVQSVRRIYRYYKQHGYETVVMGASFRNCGEIEALAGCDRLTISPPLLEQLARDPAPLPRALKADAVSHDARESLGEPVFRYRFNDNAMATEKLAEGIRQFAADQAALEEVIAAS